MTGLGIAPVPCIRCKARRVKCDKRQPGCARCEKSAQPCPGYNRVRKFLDEGENLRHKIAKGTGSRRSDSSSASVVRDSTPAKAAGSVKQASPKTPFVASPRSRTDDTNGAGIDPAIIHEHSPLAGGQSKPEDVYPLNVHPASSIAMITPRSFSDLDFDAAYFDIDPQVYYADPINCCLLIPDASQADDDEFLDPTQTASSMLSPITSFDPSAQSGSGGSSLSAPSDQDDDDEEHEASHLIRYFADFTSQWLDIFDMEKFFGTVVPVRAVHSALLKNSLAAVAAKQFGSLRKASGARSSPEHGSYPPHEQSHWRSTLDIHFDKSGPEWFYKAASFYDKAIGQMMASLQTLRVCCSPGQPFPNYAADAQNLAKSRSQYPGASPLESPHRPSNCEDVADDLLAAISVFLLYEALDNRQAEMMQHMKGAQYLLTLDVDQNYQICNATDKSCPRIASSLTPTKAWVASFWNFAWVDYVVSYTRHTAPHIDTENMSMWKAAGLPLCDFGGLCIPETLRDANMSPPRLMTETAACRTLLWIVLETLKFVAWTEMEDKNMAAEEENAWSGRVPMDWQNPSDKERVILGVTRLPARSTMNPLPPVFVNPGGPGGSGVYLVQKAGSVLQAIVGDNQDIISWDPRGVGVSTPRIECWGTPEKRQLWAMQDAGVVDEREGLVYDTYSRGIAYSRACEGALNETDILAHISTAYHARDMLEILDQTGHAKLRYWGFSYGTALGGAFAGLFPDRVERLVSDGNVDYKEWFGGGLRNYLSDADKVFDAFDTACHAAGRDKCALWASSPEAVQRRRSSLLQALKIRPVLIPANARSSGPELPERVTYTRLQRLTRALVYNPVYNAPALARVYAALEQGDGLPFYDIVVLLEKQQQGGGSKLLCSLTDTPATMPLETPAEPDALAGIMCADARAAESLDEFEAYTEDLRRSSRWMGATHADFGAACVGKTVGSKWRFSTDDIKADTSFPILYIGNIADNVTPLASARNNSALFPSSAVLVQKSYGHCSLAAPSTCTVRHIRAYFQNGTLPAAGTECEQDYDLFELPSPKEFAVRKRGGGEEEVDELERAAYELSRNADVVMHRGPYRL
ncbi:alpha beta hydrolase fold family [Purpureocillium lilacinum]|uniref:Alpha beta hydrolase fold family n=1 Tax=Purpureocillium lilacinum TaxID=33203 RepID=A0A179H5R9_PURLI|nr:alpha beta hydrolase fold family [Purpureocillium lilacinum]